MEIYEVVLTLGMSDGQTIVSPVAGYHGREVAVSVCKVVADDLQKKVSQDLASDASLLMALGIEKVEAGVRQIQIEAGTRPLGGVVLTGVG